MSGADDNENDSWRKQLNEEQSKRLELERKVEALVARRAVLKAALIEEQQTTDDLNARLNVLVAQFRALQKSAIPTSPTGARNTSASSSNSSSNSSGSASNNTATSSSAGNTTTTTTTTTTTQPIRSESPAYVLAPAPALHVVDTLTTITIEPIMPSASPSTPPPTTPLRKSQEHKHEYSPDKVFFRKRFVFGFSSNDTIVAYGT